VFKSREFVSFIADFVSGKTEMARFELSFETRDSLGGSGKREQTG
jgi:hypothetical protein